jgi:hypothetical protein
MMKLCVRWVFQAKVALSMFIWFSESFPENLFSCEYQASLLNLEIYGVQNKYTECLNQPFSEII